MGGVVIKNLQVLVKVFTREGISRKGATARKRANGRCRSQILILSKALRKVD
jgi:hypothetical protein